MRRASFQETGASPQVTALAREKMRVDARLTWARATAQVAEDRRKQAEQQARNAPTEVVAYDAFGNEVWYTLSRAGSGGSRLHGRPDECPAVRMLDQARRSSPKAG